MDSVQHPQTKRHPSVLTPSENGTFHTFWLTWFWKHGFGNNVMEGCDFVERTIPISPQIISHDDVIKWKLFPRYWPFVQGIHWSPVNSPHKGQWRGALMFSLICAWIHGWVNHREAGDLRRHHAHYGVTVLSWRGRSASIRKERKAWSWVNGSLSGLFCRGSVQTDHTHILQGGFTDIGAMLPFPRWLEVATQP